MPRTTLRPESLDFQPRPAYPYSPGARGGDMVFTAGQVAWDETGEVTGIGDVAAQTRQTLKNVVAVLREGGASVSGMHANFIVNSERQASSEDVKRLMERVMEQVYEQTGCQLEPEVVFARDLAFV